MCLSLVHLLHINCKLDQVTSGFWNPFTWWALDSWENNTKDICLPEFSSSWILYSINCRVSYIPYMHISASWHPWPPWKVQFWLACEHISASWRTWPSWRGPNFDLKTNTKVCASQVYLSRLAPLISLVRSQFWLKMVGFPLHLSKEKRSGGGIPDLVVFLKCHANMQL